MGTIRDEANTVYSDGPSGSPDNPPKSEIRALFGTVDTRVEAALAGVGEVQGTWNASSGTFPGGGTADTGAAWLVTTAGTTGGVAFRVGDRIVSITTNSSTSTYAGNWLRLAGNLDPVVNATDSGAGTANAIQVVASKPVSAAGGQLVSFEVFEANTSSTVTLQITDSVGAVISGLSVKTASGANPAAGALSAGLPVIGHIEGSTFRILSDLNSAAAMALIDEIAESFGDLDAARTDWEAAVAAAELAQEAAETARDAAFANANVYDDTAAGLADTSEGDQFFVVAGTEIVRYSHDAGPVATELARYPTSAYVDQYAITEFSVVRCVDPDYDGVTIVDTDGKILSASPIASWAAVLVGTDVKAINTETGQVITVSWQRSGTRYVGGVDNAKSKLTYGNDVSGTLTPFSEWLDARIDVAGGVTTLRYVPWHGQSLGMGDQAVPVLSAPTTGLARALGFNDGSRVINAYATSAYAATRLPEEGIRYVVPIHEDVDREAGETPCAGFAKWLADARPSTEAILSATVAVGGTTYVNIKSGTVSYDNLLRTVRRGAFIAACNGLAYDVPAVCWKHGESNSSGTSEATYKSNLVTLASDLRTDIQAITGQASGPVLVTSQYTSWGKFSVTQSGVALALLTAAIDNPTHIICAGPDYILDHASDNIHLSNIGALHSGEYYARAVKEFLADGSWLPLYPTAAVRTGDTIVATFNVPVEPLVLDTTTLTNPGNYGIEWIDNGDGNTPTISSVTVTGDDELTIVLSTTPTGTGQKLGFARTVALNTGSDINVGPRTNIRDSSTDVSIYDAAPLYNWCCVSEIAVTT
jgi:hypothetical protein